jgi:hypothetical protein
MKFLFLFLLSFSAFCETYEIPILSGKAFPTFGVGYNTDKDILEGNCWDMDYLKKSSSYEFEGYDTGNLEFGAKIAESSLSKELGISANAKFKTGAYTHKTSAKFMKSSRSNGFSITSTYGGTYEFKNKILVGSPKFNKEFDYKKMARRTPKEFIGFCGDHFIQQYVYGAKLFFNIKINFKSEESKKSFQANYSLSGPIGSFAAGMRQATKKFSSNISLEITALQMGGDITQLSNIFKAHCEQLGDDRCNNNAGRDGVMSVMKCLNNKELDQCVKVIENAANYATNTTTGFPSQLKETDDGKNGPAVVRVIAQSYKDYLRFGSFKVDERIASLKSELEKQFDNIYEQYALASYFYSDPLVRLTYEQKQKIKKMYNKLDKSTDVVTNSIINCFEKNTYESCYREKKKAMNVTSYEKEDFKIEPLIFAQYCDKGLNGVVKNDTKDVALFETMKSIMSYFEADERWSGYFNTNGEKLDKCGILGDIVHNLESLDLSGRKIETLRPLTVLDNIKQLNLSRTDINPYELKYLAEMNGLMSLDLSRTNLSNLEYLVELNSLEELYLANNDISDITILERLASLKKVDLRNNNRDLRCTNLVDVNCILKDYDNNSFTPLYSFNNIARKGHAIALPYKNEIMVIGGAGISNRGITFASSRKTETFNYRTGRYKISAILNNPRLYTQATRLNNGDVLVTGGEGATNSIEIFDFSKKTFKVLPVLLHSPRIHHESILLNDGRVLITGGVQSFLDLIYPQFTNSSVEIYDPKSETLIESQSMSVARYGHTLTKLKDGRVVILGGFANNKPIDKIEIFDPQTDSMISLRERLYHPRAFHTATLLNNGKILIAGGFGKNTLLALPYLEIFDPETGEVTFLRQRLHQARGSHGAVLAKDGSVVLMGGITGHVYPGVITNECRHKEVTCLNDAEIYDPEIELVTELKKTMSQPRAEFSVTGMDRNRSLIFGGRGSKARSSAEIFEFSAK